MDSIPFSVEGFALKKTEDKDYIVSCIKDTAIMSVGDEERDLSHLWIDDTAETVSHDIDSDFMDNEAFELLHGNENVGLLWMGKAFDQFTRERIGYVLGVYVRPEYRSKGLGKALMASAEEWCRDNGLVHLSLNVGTANKDAVKLYESLGFEQRSVVMRKLI